jgi:hypothetical protein
MEKIGSSEALITTYKKVYTVSEPRRPERKEEIILKS